jgi:hypothetical protein
MEVKTRQIDIPQAEELGVEINPGVQNSYLKERLMAQTED